ncbi:MAG: ribonuclease J [Holosporales bacterium]|jgi:ribonuclease J|nr:ribonuclease J [Holosporales bacterium]
MKKKKSQTSEVVTSFHTPTSNDIFFIPLGGTDEVGMNFSLIGHDGEWLIVDCGITFHDRVGIEVLTADPSFIIKNKLKVSGLLLTHAHEDHIGAIEYLWPLLKCPVYATPFAGAILRQKTRDKSWKTNMKVHELEFKTSVTVGKYEVEALQMSHSIPEPACFIIRTPLGTLVHTGDWKIESAPVLGKKVDERYLKQIGDRGVLAYFSDSTNIFTKEDDSSEKRVRECLIDLVQKHSDKRITVACFSSNIARLETAIIAAKQAGRKVAVVGLSLQRMIAAAKETGYLSDIPNLIDEKTAASMPGNKVLLLCTGSQGEGRSALVKIATGTHPHIKMGADDLVLFSSRVIPGNEKNIGSLQSLLAKTGTDIITSSEENIHVSGHPSCKTIKKMYDLLRPQIVVPVHGEARHLIAQSHFARGHGIPHVITPTNGTVIQLAGATPGIIGSVPCGKWAVDGKRMVDFHGSVIQERTILSEQGAIFITVAMNENLIASIDVRLLGLMTPGNLYNELKNCITDELRDLFNQKEIQNSAARNAASNANVANQCISRLVKFKIGKRPIVHTHIVGSGQLDE